MAAEVSIVIPAYNSEQYIAQSIESVLAQTFEHVRLIIIDDGSRDGTVAIAEQIAQRDSRVRVVKQANSGVAAARNNGLKAVEPETKFVLFLDNDDYLEPDAIAVLHAALVASPEAVAAYGLPRDVSGAGEPITTAVGEAFGFDRPMITSSKKIVPMAPADPDLFHSLVIWPSISTPGQVLIRRSVLEQVGLFDPYTVPSDDWDLWIRLSLHGPLKRLLRFTINKRQHEGSVSKKGKVMAVAEPRIRHKLATSPLLTAEQKQIARLGHLYSCKYKLSWSRGDLQQRRFVGASRTIYRALRSYVMYLRTPY